MTPPSTKQNKTKQIECEIYSRACGYFAPTKSFNPGIYAQHEERYFHHINKDNKDLNSD